MSSFKALNIESDDESDIEVDDTKEIQIEEALKLYQNALKFHAEGPDSFDKAAEAYRLLFESDIFKYPESQAELRYIELYGLPSEADDVWDDVLPGSVVPAGSLESGPSTLPQILHLAHKNYAQFRLEALMARFEIFNVTLNQILADATAALDHFVHALDKDDTDLDLWRRTACVGEILDSRRVARCCLESVLEGDDEGLSGILALPGLEESLAGDMLRSIVKDLQDDLTILQRPLSTSRRRTLSKILRQRLHPYEDLMRKAKRLRDEDQQTRQLLPPQPSVLKAPKTWAELGELLVRQHNTEQHGTDSARPGCAIMFDIEPQPHHAASVLDQNPRESPVETALVSDVVVTPPTAIQEQHLGADEGQPTAQLHASTTDEDTRPPTEVIADRSVSMAESSSVTLPSRKRSGESAGLNEGQEEVRTKSRRIRARDSNVDAGDSRQAAIDANTRWEYEQQLNEFQAADDWMFETIGGLFEKVGIVGLDTARHVRQDLHGVTVDDTASSIDQTDRLKSLRHARSDLHSFLENFNDQLAHIILHGDGKLDLNPDSNNVSVDGIFSSGGTSRNTTKLPAMPNEGLQELLQKVSKSWLLTTDVNWEFMQALLRPGSLIPGVSSYTKYLWPEDLKTMVVRNLVNFDSILYERASAEISQCRQAVTALGLSSDEEGAIEMVETIFELHLDVYCLIKQKNSGVDVNTITAQGDRLARWSNLARDGLQYRSTRQDTSAATDHLSLRFLWATTFHISANDDVSQDHLIECMNDLRRILVSAGAATIQLQNNAIMPELSIPALDQEISKLTTREFFAKVTDQEQSDPAALIESLEPLLEMLDSNPTASKDEDGAAYHTCPASDASNELVSFLKNSDMAIKLMLWKRLRDAYNSIEYLPMVAYSYFRTIGIILGEIKSPEFVELPPNERQITLLKHLRSLRLLVKKLFTLFQEAKDVTECIDENGLVSAAQHLGDILQMIQVFNIVGDSIRVGQAQPPSLSNGLPVTSFAAVNTAMHEMQIHIWVILYALVQEAISQYPELFSTPLEDRFDFLRTVHRNLGLRKICGCCNRVFVRLLKNEFFQMTHVDGYDSEQAQVLYDLHGLNCFLNPSYELIEHDCTRDAFIDRSVALSTVDLLLAQASKLPVKELVKHSLKDTIDRVHGALPRKRPTETILRNRDVYRAFLKSPIMPLDLFNCLKGEGNQLALSSIPKEDAVLASKGWYFLMGQIALVKFRSQKRTGPTPIEDVDIAIAFFMQSLEFTGEHWETWFRLAQAYDTKIEENVVWSAEKLNQSMSEIVQLQRSAIHCFVMATALAHRSADLAFETSGKMTELYADFAMRLYSSSREPFSMLPFAVDETDKFISTDHGIEKGKNFQPLGVYTSWKLALNFFKKALAGKPDQWTLHSMIGKCLAKMHHASEAIRRHNTPPTGDDVLHAFVRALELLPDKDKKESRDSKREPVLDPHYKLVSVVHKLVMAKSIDLERAREALSHTQYAMRASFPQDMQGWVPYILDTLKHLRVADKSNWYHRMIARAAHIMYDHAQDGSSPDHAASSAKHELTQQMFTKTMVLQVWKPETERAGRHFVYTARYTRFFVTILNQLKDRANLEALARRVRRRPHDLFEHSLVWQETCNAYLQLLRSHAQLTEGLETSTFSNIAHDDFLLRREPLEKWMQSQPQGASEALDVLRDVQELKKVNQGLMKPGVIDDLIGDSYAHLFNTIGKQLLEEERKLQQEEEARRPPPATSPPRNPMMSLTHLMNSDGNSEAPPPSGPRVVIPLIPLSSTQPDQAPVRRKIGVGRREIRTCAESCYPKGAVQNNTPAKGGVASSSRVQALVQDNTTNSANDTAVNISAPGSIHDSADESDWSELSEISDTASEKAVQAGLEARSQLPGQELARRMAENWGNGYRSSQERSTDEELEDHDTEMAVDSHANGNEP